MDVRNIIESDADDTAGNPRPGVLHAPLQQLVRMAVRASGMAWGALLLPTDGPPALPDADDAPPTGDGNWSLAMKHGADGANLPPVLDDSAPPSPDDAANASALRSGLTVLSQHILAHGEAYVDTRLDADLRSDTASGGASPHAQAPNPGSKTATAPGVSIAGIPLTGSPDPADPDGLTASVGTERPSTDAAWGMLILLSGPAAQHLAGRKADPATGASADPDHVRAVLRDAASLAATTIDGYANAAGNLRYRRFIAESDQGIYRMEMNPPVPTHLPIEEQTERFLAASHVAECNDAFARMYGAETSEEMIGLTLGDLHGDKADVNRSAQRAFIKEGYRVSNAVTQERDQDGNLHYFTNTAFSIIINGAVHRVWGIQQDITAIKETEAALNHSERLLASTLDSYPYATAIFDPELRYLYANDLAAASIHVDSDGMIGQRPEALYPSGIWEPMLPLLRRCRDEETFVQKMVTVERDGEQRVVIASFVPLFNEDESLEAIIASTRDVTEERRAKQNLRQSEQRLSLHVEHSPLAFVEWDVNGRIVKWNPAAEQTFGYSAREARGLHVADLSPYADREETRDIWTGIVSHRQTVSQRRRRNLTKAGRVILCEWSMTPLVDHTGSVIGVAATAQDVTQEVEAREALRQERDLLRGVAETSAAGIIVADDRGRISFVNTRAETLLQTRRTVLSQDFLDAEFWSARDVDGRPFNAENLPFQQVLRTGEPVFDVEMVLERPDGDVILSINAAPLHDDQGSVSQVVMVMEDITDRMARQIEVREHNDILSSLAKMQVEMRDDFEGILHYAAETARDAFDTHRVSIWQRDDATDDFVCVEVVGPGSEEDIGMRIEKPVYERYLQAIRGRRAVSSENVHTDVRLEKLATYNDERDIRSTLDAPVRIGGKLVGLVSVEHIGKQRTWSANMKNFAGSIADVVAQTFIVSEQKRARAALRRSEQRWKALVEHHPGGVMISLDGRIAYANQAALSILGASSLDEITGHPLHDIVRDEHRDTFRRRWRTVMVERETTEPWEHEITGLDGVPRTIVTQSVPITYKQQPAAQTVISDVTERRRREEQLRKAKEEAQQMNRLKSAFLANMSHEIRTPLTSIIGFAEVLEKRDIHADNDIAAIIGKSSQRLLRTLNSVLDLSKLESGAMNLSPEWIDLTSRTRESTRLFERRATEGDVAIDLQLPSEPVRARLDPSAVDRILDNLIGNAIKFTPAGGEVNVTITPQGDTVSVRVEDTGIGIPEDFRPHLFEPFQQASGTSEVNREGTGLGLAITQRLVTLMDGEIAVESTTGAGTTFLVSLPQDMTASAAST